MKIEIKSAVISDRNGETNIRIWNPVISDCFDEYLVLSLGEKGKKGSDDFCCRIATPKGLAQGIRHQPNSSIIHGRPILVVAEYSYEDIWNYAQEIIEKCHSDTWNQCSANLCRYFESEFDDYKK